MYVVLRSRLSACPGTWHEAHAANTLRLVCAIKQIRLVCAIKLICLVCANKQIHIVCAIKQIRLVCAIKQIRLACAIKQLARLLVDSSKVCALLEAGFTLQNTW